MANLLGAPLLLADGTRDGGRRGGCRRRPGRARLVRAGVGLATLRAVDDEESLAVWSAVEHSALERWQNQLLGLVGRPVAVVGGADPWPAAREHHLEREDAELPLHAA
eukprot:scaffold26093_cov66-Phaeocystis_antarctica.AAC.2